MTGISGHLVRAIATMNADVTMVPGHIAALIGQRPSTTT
jgi:hypothetical protein